MHLPHVTPFVDSPIYFLTACTAGRKPALANVQAMECLTDIWSRSASLDGWAVGRFVLMPDHVHLFARAGPDAKKRSEWMKLWKSVSARRLSRELGIQIPIWQPDTFDHILRGSESYSAKWEYVRLNPVRAGLVGCAEDWAWQGEIFSLRFD